MKGVYLIKNKINNKFYVDSSVRKIISKYQTELGRLFNVSRQNIHRIVHNKLWVTI